MQAGKATIEGKVNGKKQEALERERVKQASTSLMSLLMNANTPGQERNIFKLMDSFSKEFTEQQMKSIVNTSGTKYGETPLMVAVLRKTTTRCVRMLLNAGADVNKADIQSGMTPLMFCCIKGDNVAVLKLLMDAGANIVAQDHTSRTALLHALLHGKIKSFETIVNYTFDYGYSLKREQAAFHTAVHMGHDRLAFLLLKAGVEFDRFLFPVVGLLLVSQKLYVFETMIQNLITSAKMSGDEYSVSNHMKNMFVAVMNFSCGCGNRCTPETKRALMGLDALINLNAGNYLDEDDLGEVLLTAASLCKAEVLAKVLYNVCPERMNVNYQNESGKTALMIALDSPADIFEEMMYKVSSVSVFDNISVLLNAGADVVNLTDDVGLSAVDYAVYSMDPFVILKLAKACYKLVSRKYWDGFGTGSVVGMLPAQQQAFESKAITFGGVDVSEAAPWRIQTHICCDECFDRRVVNIVELIRSLDKYGPTADLDSDYNEVMLCSFNGNMQFLSSAVDIRVRDVSESVAGLFTESDDDYFTDDNEDMISDHREDVRQSAIWWMAMQ